MMLIGLTEFMCIEAWRVTVPVYNRRSLCLTVHRDCLSRAVTYVRSHSYLYAYSVYYYNIKLRRG